MSEEKHDLPRQEASDPGREPAPGDEVEPGTQGAAEERAGAHPRSLTGWVGDPWTRRK